MAPSSPLPLKRLLGLPSPPLAWPEKETEDVMGLSVVPQVSWCWKVKIIIFSKGELSIFLIEKMLKFDGLQHDAQIKRNGLGGSFKCARKFVKKTCENAQFYCFYSAAAHFSAHAAKQANVPPTLCRIAHSLRVHICQWKLSFSLPGSFSRSKLAREEKNISLRRSGDSYVLCLD